MKRILFLLLIGAFSFSTLVRADEDDSPGYDALVKELKNDLKAEEPTPKVDNSLHIVAGAALAGSFVDATAGSAMLTGFDIHAGMEVFSPEWIAEASLRSFSTGQASASTRISLDDYDIQLVHQSHLQESLLLRLGGGLSEQHLKTWQNGDSINSQSPSLVALVGLDKAFSKKVSLGPDVSFRMPLVGGTDEKASLDASLRVNFHF